MRVGREMCVPLPTLKLAFVADDLDQSGTEADHT